MFGSLFGQLARLGQPRSREQTLQHHNKAVEDIADFLSSAGRAVHVSNRALAKPACFGRPPALSSCSPILCNELQVNAVHEGQVLLGKLVVDALLMSSVQTVLEDAAGDVMQMFMYNVPQLQRYTPATSVANLNAAQRVLPKGQQLAILEPYYKVMADGTLGVRVDNPAEVIFLDASGCPVEGANPEPTASSSSSSSGGGGASSSSSSAAGMPSKPRRPNKKKAKGRKP